jgi:hypothetical protein
MRTLLLAVVVAALAPAAEAQIVAVRFKEAKAAAKYKDHLLTHGGQMVLVGEPLRNVRVDLEKNVITKVTGQPLEFIVADPADPTKVPYRYDGEQRIVTDKRAVVTVPEPQVEQIGYFVRDSTIAGMASDYAERKSALDELVAARNAQTKGSPAWMAAHQRVVINMERLASWLDSTLYPEAARKLEKDLAKEKKLVAEAVAARGAAARASIRSVPTPEPLTAAAQEISGGADQFKVAESSHCRVIYRDYFDDARIRALLDLAEQIIEGFRVDFVDPYADAEFADYIPEHVFAEWWFGPDDVPRHERYFTVYYRQPWGEHREERLKSEGNGFQRATSPEYVHFWRTDDNADLEGRVAHNLGHDLASIHYDRKRIGMEQDWLGEGLGLLLSLEWLGHNNVSCKDFAEPGRYVHQKKKEGEKTVQIGLRDYYNALALEKGVPIDKLALKTLYEMGDADIAKCWSFFDFVARKTGKPGQLFLRAACNAARTKDTFIKDWRANSERIFEIEGQDVFDVIDERWREFAQAGQDTGDTKRAK